MNVTQSFKERLETVDRATLMPLVRRALRVEVFDISEWDYQPVEGGFSQEHGEIYGVYRFRGTAQTQSGTTPWSLILKATGSTLTGSQEPSAFDYWKREALVYQSGLLDDLPGDLVTPRCLEIGAYSVIDQANMPGIVTDHTSEPGIGEEYWLWLEEITDLEDEVWPFMRYGEVARHLGHFNGAYAAPNSLPDVPWLSAGNFQQWLVMAEAGIAQLPRLSQHPFFKELLPGNFSERIVNLWEARERLLHLRQQLPLTFCHHDAFRRNIFTQQDASGHQKSVLIDWARAGTGVLGEELVALFATSLKFIAVDCDRLPELDAVIFTNYVDGLRESGWQGDPNLARFGFTATAALKCGVADPAIKLPNVARRIANLPPGTESPRILGPGLEQSVVVHRHLLQMGEEALDLCTQLS
jgi:hypothetical protein